MKFNHILFIFIFSIINCSDSKTNDVASAFTEIPNSFSENDIPFVTAKYNLNNQQLFIDDIIKNFKDNFNNLHDQNDIFQESWREHAINFEKLSYISMLINTIYLAFNDIESYNSSDDNTITLSLPTLSDINNNEIINILHLIDNNNFNFFLRVKDYNRIQDNITSTISLYELFYKIDDKEKILFKFAYNQNMENEEEEKEFEIIFDNLKDNILNIKYLYKQYTNDNISFDLENLEINGGISLVFGKRKDGTNYFGLSSNGTNIISEDPSDSVFDISTQKLKTSPNEMNHQLFENGLIFKGCLKVDCAPHKQSTLSISGGTKLNITIDSSNNNLSTDFIWGNTAFFRFFIESFDYEYSYLFSRNLDVENIDNFSLLNSSGAADTLSYDVKRTEVKNQLIYLKNKLFPEIVFTDSPDNIKDQANNIIQSHLLMFKIILDLLE